MESSLDLEMSLSSPMGHNCHEIPPKNPCNIFPIQCFHNLHFNDIATITCDAIIFYQWNLRTKQYIKLI